MAFFDEYPYSNLHNVNLDWVLQRVKEWGEMVEDNNTRFETLQQANEDFKAYVTNYIENLDYQTAIDDKIDRMFASGVLGEYLQPYVSPAVTTWLGEHITEPTGVVIDTSLTISGACADAKITGDKFLSLGLTTDARNALVDAFNNMVFSNADRTYVLNVIDKLFETIPEWDNGYLWMYTPYNGLLSEQIYVTMGVVGSGGNETLEGTYLNLKCNNPPTTGNNSLRFDFTPSTNSYNRLLVKANIVHSFTNTAPNQITGGFQIVLSNGENGLLFYIGSENGMIKILFYKGNTINYLTTQIPIEGNHIFDAILTANNQILKIDGVEVLNETVFSTFYTTLNRMGLTCTSSAYTPQGTEVNVIWLCYYNRSV